MVGLPSAPVVTTEPDVADAQSVSVPVEESEEELPEEPEALVLVVNPEEVALEVLLLEEVVEAIRSKGKHG